MHNFAPNKQVWTDVGHTKNVTTSEKYTLVAPQTLWLPATESILEP